MKITYDYTADALCILFKKSKVYLDKQISPKVFAGFDHKGDLLQIQIFEVRRRHKMFAMTKLSSKGQVVIPEEIRQELGLETGSQFLIYAEKDSIVLKLVQKAPKEDFDKIFGDAQRAAKKAGLKKEMIDEEIKNYRKQWKKK